MSRQRLAATRLLMQLLEAEGDLVSLPSGGECRDEIDLLILERLIRAAVRREWLRCPECHEQECPQGSRQSIGSAPFCCSSSFARLNGRDPKNPRDADKGDGCGDSMVAQSPSAISLPSN